MQNPTVCALQEGRAAWHAMADGQLAPTGEDLEEVLYAAQAQRVRHAVVCAGQAQAQLLDQVQPVRARSRITRYLAASH